MTPGRGIVGGLALVGIGVLAWFLGSQRGDPKGPLPAREPSAEASASAAEELATPARRSAAIEAARADALEGTAANRPAAEVGPAASVELPEGDPDLVVDLALDVGLEGRDLELWRHGRWESWPSEATLDRDGRRVSVWVTDGDVSGTLELRTVPPGGSTGQFYVREASAAPIALRLRAVRHFELELSDGSGTTVGGWNLPDTFEWTRAGAVAPYVDARGEPRQQRWVAKLLPSEDGRRATLTPCPGPTELSVNLEGYATRSYRLGGQAGVATRQTLVLDRLAVAGRLSGTVRTASGADPDPERLSGRVRIVDVSDRNIQWGVDLEWEDGVSRWESAPLPFGEYRVWLDDLGGGVHVTPYTKRVLSPPRANVDWTWEDASERRTLAVRVFAAESGERLDEYTVAFLADRIREYEEREHTRPLVRRGTPVDFPSRFVVSAQGRAARALTVADFSLPGRLDAQGHEVAAGGEPAWFCEVFLARE